MKLTNGKGRPTKIPDIEDLPLISELLLTHTATQVAVKWNMSRATLYRFLDKHGTSIPRIHHEYRVPFIQKHLNLGMHKKDIAKLLGITKGQLYHAYSYLKKETVTT